MVKILSDPSAFSEFEETYLQLREAEGRVLTDEQVRALPDAIGLSDSLKFEWSIRKESIKNLKNYFDAAQPGTNVLDVGCGNGWAAAALADNKCLQVTAIDVNRLELEQADRIFKKENLQFCFGDLFAEIFPAESFDSIILSAALQYFPNPKKLIGRLFYFLKQNGELHFVDTPVYEISEVPEARKRTQEYYSRMGFQDMAAHYFHHSWEDLAPFHPKRMNNRKLWWQFLKRKRASHLSWILIKKS